MSSLKPTIKLCLTVRELAKRWRCRPARIRELVRRRLLKPFKLADGVGRRGTVRITPEEVERFESDRSAAPPKRSINRRKVEVGDYIK